MSDTFALQRAGWKISMLQNPHRGLFQVALKHDGLRMEAISESIRFPFQSLGAAPDRLYGERYFDQLVIRLSMLGAPMYIHMHGPMQFESFKPVDATPRFVEGAPRKLSDLVLFAPAVQEDKQLIIKPGEIGRVLEMIAAAQEPGQAEIRARMRQQERREEFKNVLHAQLYSVA